MDRLTRLKRRQELREQWKKEPHLHEALPAHQTLPFLSSVVDLDRIDQLSKPLSLQVGSEITLNDARVLLRSLRSEFDHMRIEQFMEQTQHNVLQAIITPLGLGRVVALFDKDGGAVTTIHNAQQGIYANTEDKYDRKDYTAKANSKGERFEGNGSKSVGSRSTRQQMDDDGLVTDRYTGRREQASHTSPDHIVSNNEFHQAGGFMLNQTRKADFGTDEDNLALTRRDINQSMRDEDKLRWAKKHSGGRDADNQTHFDVDGEHLAQAHQQGQQVKERHLPTATEKLAYYTLNGTKASVLEGVKMGAQQALGWLLVEFFSGLMLDVKDCFTNKRNFKEACRYLARQGRQRISDLKTQRATLLSSFKNGLISGMFSSLLTLVTNLFTTTYRRSVRLIREGIFTLGRALKILLIPNEHTSWRDAAHSALLLVCNGSIVIAGIALEDTVAALLAPFPFGGVLSAVIIGALCALAMAWLTYWLEQRDFFGVIGAEEDQFINAALDKMLVLPT